MSVLTKVFPLLKYFTFFLLFCHAYTNSTITPNSLQKFVNKNKLQKKIIKFFLK